MHFKPSIGAKKAFGMAMLYFFLPLFVAWFAIFELKLVRLDLTDIALFLVATALLAYLYKRYLRKVRQEQGMQGEWQETSETGGANREELSEEAGAEEMAEEIPEEEEKGEDAEEEVKGEEAEEGEEMGLSEPHRKSRAKKAKK